MFATSRPRRSTKTERDAEPSDRRRKVRAFVEFSRKRRRLKTAKRRRERADERKTRRKRYRLKTFDGGASRRFFSANGRRASSTFRRAVVCLNITQTRRQKSLSFRLYARKLEKTPLFLKFSRILGEFLASATFFKREKLNRRRKRERGGGRFASFWQAATSNERVF